MIIASETVFAAELAWKILLTKYGKTSSVSLRVRVSKHL